MPCLCGGDALRPGVGLVAGLGDSELPGHPLLNFSTTNTQKDFDSVGDFI